MLVPSVSREVAVAVLEDARNEARSNDPQSLLPLVPEFEKALGALRPRKVVRVSVDA
jgi:hypothetical protein